VIYQSASPDWAVRGASRRETTIQNLGGKLYVTYAVHSKQRGDLPTTGSGFVNVFDTNGTLLKQLASGHPLKAPWGVAIAPADFGSFGGAVLVGNFLDGRIGAYNPATGDFLGRLRDQVGQPISIEGLFGLTFANGASGGDRGALYFAAGPGGMQHGLFGSIRFNR